MMRDQRPAVAHSYIHKRPRRDLALVASPKGGSGFRMNIMRRIALRVMWQLGGGFWTVANSLVQELNLERGSGR
jgi:hypothetical protein